MIPRYTEKRTMEKRTIKNIILSLGISISEPPPADLTDHSRARHATDNIYYISFTDLPYIPFRLFIFLIKKIPKCWIAGGVQI